MSAIVNDRQNSLDGLDELLSPALSPFAQINLRHGDSRSRDDSKSRDESALDFPSAFEINGGDEGFDTNDNAKGNKEREVDGESNERDDDDERYDDRYLQLSKTTTATRV